MLNRFTGSPVLVEDMAYRPHAAHSPAAREAAKSFKATEVWWRR